MKAINPGAKVQCGGGSLCVFFHLDFKALSLLLHSHNDNESVLFGSQGSATVEVSDEAAALQTQQPWFGTN